jgi:hypothetical protein
MRRLAPPKPCQRCGALFNQGYYTSRARWESIRFCSPRCGSLGNRNKRGKTGFKVSEENRKRTGELARARGRGLSSLNRQIINSPQYRLWRTVVFQRDLFTCQGCSVKGGLLEAHHIKASSIIRAQYRITTLQQALACEELWDINNGLTLCKPCHKKTDNYAKGLRSYSANAKKVL